MIRFSDMSKTVYSVHPIQKASRVDGAHKKEQLEKHNRETFVDCPGIFDFKNTGWIMTAWDEFKIYCSDNATMAYIGGQKRPGVGSIPQPIEGFKLPEKATAMSPDITDGIPKATGCPVKRLQPLHFQAPWMVETDEEISLLLLPPTYHSDIVDNFIIYPGIVDYTDKFSTLNLIMSPKREGTFVIKAGTPILHIIPIEKKTYNAEFGPAKKSRMGGIMASCNQFYRKYVMKRSKYNLDFVDDV